MLDRSFATRVGYILFVVLHITNHHHGGDVLFSRRVARFGRSFTAQEECRFTLNSWKDLSLSIVSINRVMSGIQKIPKRYFLITSRHHVEDLAMIIFLPHGDHHHEDTTSRNCKYFAALALTLFTVKLRFLRQKIDH